MEWIDSYVVRARLFPAVLAIAPGIAFALAQFVGRSETIGAPQLLISTAIAVLFFGFSDLSRRLGRSVERRMFVNSGGRPFPTVLRHRDKQIDPKSKARYHAYLSLKLAEKAPTEALESQEPGKADEFYLLSGNWLRERTRDHLKYKVLFEENVVYGFRRNLLGLKWVGLSLNATVVAASIWMMSASDWRPTTEYGAVLVVAALHAVFFLVAVSEGSVRDASDQYGRQLALSCETLMAEDEKAPKA